MLLGGRIGMTKSESCAEFFGGLATVPLLLEDLAEIVARLESGTFLDGSSEIAAQQADGHRIVAAGAQQEGGAIHERVRIRQSRVAAAADHP